MASDTSQDLLQAIGNDLQQASWIDTIRQFLGMPPTTSSSEVPPAAIPVPPATPKKAPEKKAPVEVPPPSRNDTQMVQGSTAGTKSDTSLPPGGILQQALQDTLKAYNDIYDSSIPAEVEASIRRKHPQVQLLEQFLLEQRKGIVTPKKLEDARNPSRKIKT